MRKYRLLPLLFALMTGCGVFDISNASGVEPSTASRLAFSTIATPYPSDTPLNAQVFAVDENGALVTDVGGPATVEAVATFSMLPTSEGASADSTLFPAGANARSQMLLTVAEMGNTARTLRWLTFDVSSIGAGSQTYSNVSLRMKHYAANTMTGGWEVAEWIPVFQGTLTLSTGQKRVVFQAPFVFNGVDNVLLDISFENATAAGGASVTGIPIAAGDTRRIALANGPPTPTTWTASTPAPVTGINMPSITFGYEGPIIGTANLTLVNGSANVPMTLPGTLPVVFLRGATSSPTPPLSGESNVFALAAPSPLPADAPTTIFSDGFESGVLGPQWTVTGTVNHRTQVTTANGPRQAYHMLMDASATANSRNEATLTVDLAGKSGVTLKFWMKENSDEDNAPLTNPFTNGADFDGVAISQNGLTWYEVQPLRGTASSNSYKEFTVSLDPFVAAQGWSYNAAFKIRFNHYDNSPWASGDGFAFDDVSVSAYPTTLVLSLTLPVSLSEGGNGSAKVSMSSTTAADTIVSLASNLPGRILLPDFITILAGSSEATFSIGCINDDYLTGASTASIKASAASARGVVQSVTVSDDEILGAMTLALPSTINEGENKSGKLYFPSPAIGPVQVAISTDAPTQLTLPSSATMSGGNLIATFSISRSNNFVVLDDGPVSVTASALGSQTAGTLTALDNDPRTFSIVMPASYIESGPTQNATLKLTSILHTLGRPLEVSLSSSPDLVASPTVTMPLGANSMLIPVRPVDNQILDGTRTASLTASATTFTDAVGNVSVSDDDPHHFVFGSIASSQVRNKPFALSISARTIDDKAATAFQQEVNLTAAASGIQVPISPSVTSPFVVGAWSGNVTIGAFGSGIVITANQQAITGTSGSFNVVPGGASRLVWDQFPASATIGQPFAARVHVDDGYDNTVTSENSTVTFAFGSSAYIGEDNTYDDSLLGNYSTERRTTCIYRASELGGASKLLGLGISYHGSLPSGSANNWNRWTVRLKHSQRADFSAGNPWEVDGWTTVYQGSFTIPWEGWIMFPFSTPFVYNGTDSLMVDFSFDNSIAGGTVYSWMQGTNSILRSASGVSSGTHGDPLSWSGSTPSPSYKALVPSLRLISENAPSGELLFSPTTFVNGIWQGTITIPRPFPAGTILARKNSPSGYSSLQGRTSLVQFNLPTPVMTLEPPYSGGGVNVIEWMGGSSWDEGFLVQRSVDTGFSSAESIGWVSPLQAQFSNLPDGQQQYYRVKSHAVLDDERTWWTQTITTGFMGSEATGVAESNGVIKLAASSLTEFHEDFDRPGTFLSQSIFSEGELYGSATSSRASLSGVNGVPSTAPPLPINQGGDLEGRMTASNLNPVNYYMFAAWNLFQYYMVDCTIEGYLHMVNPPASTAAASLVLRTNKTSLNGYAATIQQVSATTWALKLQEMVSGNMVTLTSSSIQPPEANSCVKVRFSVTGTNDPVLRASLWRVSTDGVNQIEVPEVFPGGATFVEVTDTANSPSDFGYPAIHGTMNQGGDLFFDDITISSSEPLYAEEGFFTSPVLGGDGVTRWGVVDWNAKIPANTSFSLDVLDTFGAVLATNVQKGADLGLISALNEVKRIKLRARLATTDRGISPSLNSWELSHYVRTGATVESLWSNTVSSTQDATPPSLTFISGQFAYTTLSSYNLIGIASDATSGMASVRVNDVIATTGNGFANWSHSLPGLVNGSNNYTVIANDNAVPPNTATVDCIVYRIATPQGDSDADGISDLLSAALNLAALPNRREGLPLAQVQTNEADGQRYLTLQFRRRVPTRGFVYDVETSIDLVTWTATNADVQEIGATPNSDGQTETVTVRVNPATSAVTQKFVRLKVWLP